MLLLIDNYDSFTHNLARYFVELGQEVHVVRNNEISCAGIRKLAPQYLVLSPGPCTPAEAGVTMPAISEFAGKIPMLGVCLGHQAIGQVFGANLINAKQIKHGKTAQILHSNSLLFKQVSHPFTATRYHSLLLDHGTIPDCFDVTAWCDSTSHEPEQEINIKLSTDKTQMEVMAIEHKSLPIFGVQFHPESLLTEFGHTLLSNYIDSIDKF
jgi:para-aminobenzoate synthetase component 2